MSKQDQKPAVMQRETIVDADVHVTISADDLAPYLDEPHRSRILSTSTYPGSPGSDWDTTLSGKIDQRQLDGPEAVEEDLVKKLHIDHPLLNNISGVSRLPDTDLAVELMRATNDVLLDKYLDQTEFFGLGVVAPQAPDKAAEEIDRLGDESQIKGIFLETYGQQPPRGDPSHDAIYQAAADNGLHIAFHGAAATGFKVDFPMQNQGAERFLTIHTLAHLWQQTLALTSLLVQGVPAKFPELNFVFLEAGISWVPYMMWRLNKEYSMRRSEAPLLEKSPEEYIRDQFYFASQPLGEPNTPAQLQQVLDIVGPESLMFATDYPHWDFDHPTELDDHLQAYFSPEEREQVLHKTPVEAFDLTV